MSDELAPNFPGNAPSTITIRATSNSQQSVSSGTLQVSYGSAVLDFYPVEKSDGTITCTGTLMNTQELMRGMTLQVAGVGGRFSGSYLVSGTVHSFDQVKGQRTAFWANRATVARSLTNAKRTN